MVTVVVEPVPTPAAAIEEEPELMTATRIVLRAVPLLARAGEMPQLATVV